MLKMKRIIGGRTYNTETSTFVVDAPLFGLHDPFEGQGYLYQNRYGAFFRVEVWSSLTEPAGDNESLSPMTEDEVRQWLKTRHPDRSGLAESFFNGAAAASGEVKFTLRMPESLRDRLAERAKEANQSLNAWMVRCLERGEK